MKSNKNKGYMTTTKNLWDNYENPKGIEYNDFMSIIKTFNYLFMKSMIDQGYVYSLPNKLGIMLVTKYKQPKGKKLLNFAHYMKTGEKIYITNKHSDGFRANFKWLTRNYYTRIYKGFHQMASFHPVRRFKRYLADCIKNRQTMDNYIEIFSR